MRTVPGREVGLQPEASVQSQGRRIVTAMRLAVAVLLLTILTAPAVAVRLAIHRARRRRWVTTYRKRS
jgi:hypothetical protein